MSVLHELEREEHQGLLGGKGSADEHPEKSSVDGGTVIQCIEVAGVLICVCGGCSAIALCCGGVCSAAVACVELPVKLITGITTQLTQCASCGGNGFGGIFSGIFGGGIFGNVFGGLL